jgi:hypothetical protein
MSFSTVGQKKYLIEKEGLFLRFSYSGLQCNTSTRFVSILYSGLQCNTSTRSVSILYSGLQCNTRSVSILYSGLQCNTSTRSVSILYSGLQCNTSTRSVSIKNVPFEEKNELPISLHTQGPGGSMSKVVGLPNNSYKPITNTAWLRARLCKLQKRVHLTSSRK